MNTNTAILLYIETATDVCSVAVACGTILLAKRESADGYAHAEKLFVYIDEVMREARLKPRQLDGVVISEGPGSYTGLRIGASAAKGLIFGLGIPLIAISTLTSLFYASKQRFNNKDYLYAPMIDARRMEVYTTFYKHNTSEIGKATPVILDENYAAELLKEKTIIFSGNGAPKAKVIINHPNAQFDFTPLSAENLIIPALLRFGNQQFEDAAYFEPNYLKEYVAIKSQVKGLS